MDPLKIIQIEALYALLKNTAEYNVRVMQRWYSEHCVTPLHIVEDELDLERVALHFFECRYERMTPEEREEELKKLVENDAERMDRLRKEEAGVDDDDAFLQQAIQEAKKAALNLSNVVKNPEAEPIIPVPVMGNSKPTTFEDQPLPPKIPEGITMEFGSEAEEPGEWDLFGPPKPDTD